ncbi:SIR2 family protein [candidate division KSB1 bacterium]|nr:SIR2 family protein [candidate division KSB1 bacterium]
MDIQKPNPKSVSDVIRSIKESINNGLGIVPLIGAGMSAASGIPAGLDYQAYLFYCLARVFGTDGNGKPMEPWNPGTLRWPDYSDVPIYQNIRESMRQWSEIFVKNIKRDTGDNSKGETIDYAIWQAIGAVADWRAMLNLLSRLKYEDGTVSIKHSDTRVIDSFFVNLMRGKQPNTAYLLLAHLDDILRIKVILTTNFDNLIELSFQQISKPIAVFDVHMDASLPDADFVRAQRSIVKMHGGRYGLRADFSLDKYPTTDDVEKFVSYLSMYKKDGMYVVNNQRNLLVMGVSGNERRTVALICRAMVILKELEVYWLCYREDQVKIVHDAFMQTLSVLQTAENIEHMNMLIGDRIKICVASNLSLFMLELYQNIFLSLPPGGVPFHAVWAIPPKPDPLILNINNDKIKELMDVITSANKNILLNGESRVSSIASAVFYELSSIFHCVWIDLTENFDIYDFAFSIIDSLAYEAGISGLVPVYIHRHNRENKQKQMEQLKVLLGNLARYSTRRFVVFINGRDFPGPIESVDYKRWEKEGCLLDVLMVLEQLSLPDIKYIFLNRDKNLEYASFQSYQIQLGDETWKDENRLKNYQAIVRTLGLFPKNKTRRILLRQ